MKRLSRPARLAFAAALAVAVPACAPTGPNRLAVYPVKGQVIYQGKPAAGANVLFFLQDSPDKNTGSSHGKTDDEGWFTLTTYITGDGAPAGEHVVCVILPAPRRQVAIREADEDNGSSDRLQGKYANPKTSPLRRVVPAGGGIAEKIELK
jgi:hypothetical protein